MALSSNHILTTDFKTPYGEMVLGSFQDQLCIADWKYRKMRQSIDKRVGLFVNARSIDQGSEVTSEAKYQLEQYFNRERTTFDIPLLFAGSEFQQTVWNKLMAVSYGTTESYAGLSRLLGNEKAIRAVATANGANALSIFVPCHRIIGSDGSLVGYAGGLTVKKRLLKLEGSIVENQTSLF